MIPGTWCPVVLGKYLPTDSCTNMCYAKCRCIGGWQQFDYWLIPATRYKYLLPDTNICYLTQISGTWYLVLLPGSWCLALVLVLSLVSGTGTGTSDVWAMRSAGAWESNCNLTNWLPNNRLPHIGGSELSPKKKLAQHIFVFFASYRWLQPEPKGATALFPPPPNTLPSFEGGCAACAKLVAQIVSPKSNWCANGSFAVLQSTHEGPNGQVNKLASLEVTLVQNYDWPTNPPTEPKCRATSKAKKKCNF